MQQCVAVCFISHLLPAHFHTHVAVCCSVLQCVAVCCSAFPFTATTNVSPVSVRCSVLKRVAACCSVLQWALFHIRYQRVFRMCCSMLQRVAACRNVAQVGRVEVKGILPVCKDVTYVLINMCSHQHVRCLRVFRMCCSVLQCVAVCCSVLQCVVRRTHQHPLLGCSQTVNGSTQKLQHTATHCNTLQHTATHCNIFSPHKYCNTLQHTHHAATHLKRLQHVSRLRIYMASVCVCVCVYVCVREREIVCVSVCMCVCMRVCVCACVCVHLKCSSLVSCLTGIAEWCSVLQMPLRSHASFIPEMTHSCIPCRTAAPHCLILPHTATHCNTLQHTLQHTECFMYAVAHNCLTLLHTATHCNAHCNILNDSCMQCHTMPHTAV